LIEGAQRGYISFHQLSSSITSTVSESAQDRLVESLARNSDYLHFPMTSNDDTHLRRSCSNLPSFFVEHRVNFNNSIYKKS
tara:strand:+ start:72662 stop:72904 length:243 start_codon:yes stop_codon:yes gene_type:complete